MADEAHISVEVAYHCAQQVCDVFHQATPTQVRKRIRRSKIWAKLGAFAVFIGLMLTLWIPS